MTLDSVPGRPQLGAPLTVGGRARAYAGQATDGASVQLPRDAPRAVAAVSTTAFGGGRGGYPPGPRGGSQRNCPRHYYHRCGGALCPHLHAAAGRARPGRGGWEPGYAFEITADVTDAAGETRTGTRTVSIGRNPLSLQLTGPGLADKQALPPFRLLSTNATGEPLPAAGTLRLLARRYRPNPPGVPGPTPPTEANEAAPELLKTLAFDTKTSPDLDLRAALAALPTGRYRLEALKPPGPTRRGRGSTSRSTTPRPRPCPMPRPTGSWPWPTRWRPASGRRCCSAAARPTPACCSKWSAPASCCATSG